MKKVACSWMILAAAIILAGCWDVQDVSNRAYISAIGLDEDEGEGYKVTFEIVQPTLLNQVTVKKANLVHTIESSSIGTAVQRLQARIPRPLSLAHIRVLVVGEALAKQKKFLDIADFFNRNPNIQKRIRLVMVQGGKAQDILEMEPSFDKYIAKELISMSQLRLPLVRNNTFLEFVSDLRGHDGRGFVTRALASEKDKMIIRHGGGVYNNWRLVGWLTSDQTRDANWLVGENNVTIDAKRENSVYTYLVDTKSLKITPIHENGKLRFNVKLKTAGAIMQEQGEHLNVTKPKTLRKLETLFATVIKGQVESAIRTAQHDFRVDYLGFDTIIQQTDPEMYEKIDWNAVFPTIPIDVKVESRVSRFGLSK